MAVGIAGSTFTAELNRLANGGTYPSPTAFLPPVGAANKWAGTTGLGLIGALNKKNGVINPSLYSSLNTVCNALAGTTGKSAIDALRGISS